MLVVAMISPCLLLGSTLCPVGNVLIDTSYCWCAQFTADPYPVCHGGGAKNYIYSCGQSNECGPDCKTDWTKTVFLLKKSVPTCVDTGYWPWGPECNETSDCTITGWTDTFANVQDCYCDYCVA